MSGNRLLEIAAFAIAILGLYLGIVQYRSQVYLSALATRVETCTALSSHHYDVADKDRLSVAPDVSASTARDMLLRVRFEIIRHDFLMLRAVG